MLNIEKTWSVDTSPEGLAKLILGVCVMAVGMADLLELFDITVWISVRTIKSALLIGSGLYVAFARR